MEDHENGKKLCIVCRDTLTDIHADGEDGSSIRVCAQCLESSRENFIWVCMHCGNVYIRPKALVLQRLTDPGLRKAYLACEGLQMIQGIERCIACDPQEIVEIVAASRSARAGGHC